MNYYAKEIPRSPIYMPNGDVVTFETVDGVTAYYATERTDYIAVFDKMIEEHKGGLSVIDQATYDAFKKKQQASAPYVFKWNREEITGGPLMDTVMSRAAVAVEPAKAPVTVDTGKPAPVKATPRIGKRIAPEDKP